MNEYLLERVQRYMDIDTKLLLGILPKKLTPPPLDISKPKYIFLKNKKKIFKFSWYGVETFSPIEQVSPDCFTGMYTYEVIRRSGIILVEPFVNWPIFVSGAIKIVDE